MYVLVVRVLNLVLNLVHSKSSRSMRAHALRKIDHRYSCTEVHVLSSILHLVLNLVHVLVGMPRSTTAVFSTFIEFQLQNYMYMFLD